MHLKMQIFFEIFLKWVKCKSHLGDVWKHETEQLLKLVDDKNKENKK